MKRINRIKALEDSLRQCHEFILAVATSDVRKLRPDWYNIQDRARRLLDQSDSSLCPRYGDKNDKTV